MSIVLMCPSVNLMKFKIKHFDNCLKKYNYDKRRNRKIFRSRTILF